MANTLLCQSKDKVTNRILTDYQTRFKRVNYKLIVMLESVVLHYNLIVVSSIPKFIIFRVYA